MEIKYLELSWNEAKEKINDWNDLLSQSDFPNPFVSIAFYDAWVNTFVDDISNIKVIFFYYDNNLVGIAPLMIDIERKTIAILGDKDLFDYRDVIVNPIYSEHIYELLFNKITQENNYNDFTFILESIPEQSGLLNYSDNANTNNQFVKLEEDVTPIINLVNDWEEYLMSLSKKQRHEVRRKVRKFEAQNFSSNLITDKIELNDFNSEFFDLFVKSRQDKEEFLTEQRKKFFIQMLNNFADIEQLRILCLYDDQKLISACIVIDYDETYFLYNNAYSLMYNSFSVGLVSKIFAIKESIDRNKKKFNFLRGNEKYKYSLGGEDIKLFNVRVN
mgnify:FL=1